jgi:hypothetical protein
VLFPRIFLQNRRFCVKIRDPEVVSQIIQFGNILLGQEHRTSPLCDLSRSKRVVPLWDDLSTCCCYYNST